MKKWYVLIGVLFVALGIGFGIYYFNSQENNPQISDTNNNDNSYNASRITTNDVILDNNTDEKKSESTNKKKTSSQKEISSFSTTIYTKESDRQNNISIACSALNNTTVKDGATFSFANTVGKTTYGKGYEKADVYVDGEVEHALGRRYLSS